VVPDARRLTSIRHEEMLEMAEAGAGVLQPRSVEIAQAHGVDIHLRSSFSNEEGTWIRREAGDIHGGGFEGSGAEVAGIGHRRHESVYTVDGVGVGAVAAALADRGIAIGAVVPDATGTTVRFTAPGAETTEVTAALDAIGVAATLDEELGSVSVVSLGISRKPAITVRALEALESAGITPRMVTTTSGRVTASVPSAQVEGAVRLLHDLFIPAASAGTVSDLHAA